MFFKAFPGHGVGEFLLSWNTIPPPLSKGGGGGGGGVWVFKLAKGGRAQIFLMKRKGLVN